MTKRIFIRTALASEQNALEALQRRASLSNPGDHEAILANPDAIDLPLEQIAAGGVFVAHQDAAIAGFAAVLPRPDGETELDALFVEPHLWRHGVGRSLVQHCAEFARAQGSHALHVIGNPHAESFYMACGFQRIGNSQTRFGVGFLLRKGL